MTVSLASLAAASNGPPPGPDARPNMISVGNSLMWGQGLKPEHRFRELVRQRLTQEVDVVVELSMARSGAKLHPVNNPGVSDSDTTISDSLDTPPVEPIYSPSDFTREVPHSSLTTIQQLLDAEKILTDETNADPADIRWIILDGGINDVGIEGILAPIAAYQDGYFLPGWYSWILDKAKVIQNEMELTLRTAVSRFPNAVIVVNGYFPVFSYHSIANVTKLQSVGLLYNIANLVLTNPFGLDALATASTTWQAASNKHLRRAVRTVSAQNPNRLILFARSNIEGNKCLFAPGTWLWGYDAIPDDVPDSASHWVQWFAGATPEDEVIDQRIARCNVLTSEASESIPCRLASIGHPNTAGAQDYAQSIIEALEDAGAISSTLHECTLQRRKRKKFCTDLSDEWSYKCIETDAAIGKACAKTVKATGTEALEQISEAGNHLGQARKHLGDAVACFTEAGYMGKAASRQLEQAVNRFNQAVDHLEDAVECWDQTAIDMQACTDTEDSERAACSSAFDNRVNGPCNIRCNSYRNCRGRYGKYDPRRYGCLTARGICVAAAATARGTCIAGAALVLGACRTAAWTKGQACRAGVVLGNIVCTGGETAGAVWDAAVGIGHASVGTGAAVAEFSSDSLYALGNVGRASVDVGKSIGHGVAAVSLGIATGVIFIGCEMGRWVINRSCRLGNWVGRSSCNITSTFMDGLCWLTVPFKTVVKGK